MVAFSDGGTPICGVQQVDPGTGTATCRVGYKTAGTHQITAAYSGDTAYGASTGSLAETVNNVVTTTTTAVTSSANPSVTGQAVTYTATVSPGPDGGTVAFSDGSAPISGCDGLQVDTSGTATCTVTYSTTGTHQITAAYSGDTAYGASSNSLTQTVNYPVPG